MGHEFEERMTESPQKFHDLMERVRQGSQEAGQELYQLYGHHILHVVRRKLHAKLRPKFDSIDFVQDVWASFFADQLRQRTFSTPEELIAFLASVARHKVVDAFRQRMQRRKYNITREHSLDGSAAFQVEKLIGPDPTASQVAVAKEAYDKMTNGQPDRYRRIVELLRQGHSHEEIADTLGLNEKTIRRLVEQLKAGA
jgi:RNA polymerase sigma-70 factor (ECF subfamily)